jgi:carboxylesterase 2
VIEPVRTEGGLVSGVPALLPSVTVFKGIPYAAAPSGELRWRPPEPAAPWEGVRVADTFGDICPQTWQRTELPMSEDCLSLNVWTTAASPDERRPVLVWIYGGRFVFGSGAEPLYDGSALAEAGLVVVTLNYRVGVFGFLATPELSAQSGHDASGNYGLLDQIAALGWIKRNIAAFGGDPGRVTIAGQSAGAACVQDLIYSPLARGLFSRAIAESGALFPGDPALEYLASSYRTKERAEAQGARYQKEHGAATLAELRALPVEQLLAGMNADDPGDGHHRPPLFRPVRDGWVFPLSYHEALASGSHADVPVITGTNKDEDGASPRPDVTLADYLASAHATYGDLANEFLALYPASDERQAGEQANAAARDKSRTSSHLWAVQWSATAGSPVFSYFWTHAAPGPDAGLRGAFHGAEINYVFGNLYATDRPWTQEDREIAATMTGYVANFAATGDPNGPGLPHWAPAGEGVRETMELGDAFGPIPVADQARFEFHRRYLRAQPTR